MKILHTAKIVGIAGAENYLLKALPAMKAKGLDICFLSLTPENQRGDEAEFNRQLRESGIQVYTIYYKRIGLKTRAQIRRLIQNEQPDLVHSHLIHADFFMAITRKLSRKKFKLVSTKHGHDETYMNNHGFDANGKKEMKFHWVARSAEKQIHRSFAISKGLRDLFVSHGICKGEKIDTIYYGFDFNNEHIKENPELRESPKQLVFVGRFTELKGHRQAIEAVRLLLPQFPKLKLVLIGSGYFEDEMKRLVADLDLKDQVLFKGYQSNSIDYMASSDVVLIPSKAEGFGLVLLEAYSVKKTVVTFDVPALNEHIIDGQTGLLATPYESESLAEKVRELLAHPEQCSSMGEAGYQHLKENYMLDKMISETLNFYQRCI